MNLTCDICRDLIGLYKDKIASEDTVKAVNQHLKDCPDCRKYYQSYDSVKWTDTESCTVPINEEYHIKHYHDVSKRLQKRYHLYTSVVSALTLASVALITVNLVKFVKHVKTDGNG